jgi:hypothetical protein
MKKIFSSRWVPVLVGGVLFVVTMIGLTFVTKKMIGQNTEILDLVERLKVAKRQQEQDVTNATNKPPETIVDATKTDDNIENDQEKQKLAAVIDNSFKTINDISDPGELKFDNPALPPLMDALARQRDYLRNRERDLIELEGHISEQLQELHWQTNRITRSQAELDKLFENRVTFIKQQEVEQLKNLARIYESMMGPDQPDPGPAIQAYLKANQSLDPTLNAKIFHYLAPTNQARIINGLVVGEGANLPLYQDIIQSIRKTMPSPGLVPTAPTPTP